MVSELCVLLFPVQQKYSDEEDEEEDGLYKSSSHPVRLTKTVCVDGDRSLWFIVCVCVCVCVFLAVP